MSPKQYRKKPVVIEAMQFTSETAQEVADWCGGEVYERRFMGEFQTLVIAINTLEGLMEGVEGDFVIKGVADEFYPCKPDIFEKTYEEVVAPHANATVSGTWQNTM